MKLTLDDWMPPQPDFELFHIYCHQKDYRLCHALNQHFRLELTRKRDLFEILEKDNETEQEKKERLEAITFPQLEYIDEVIHREVFVISNHANENGLLSTDVAEGNLFAPTEMRQLLIPELPRVDYFFQIYGQIDDAELDAIEDRLNMIPLINAAKRVNPSSLTSYLNLMH